MDQNTIKSMKTFKKSIVLNPSNSKSFNPLLEEVQWFLSQIKSWQRIMYVERMVSLLLKVKKQIIGQVQQWMVREVLLIGLIKSQRLNLTAPLL